jgi:glycerol kinase
VIPSFSGLGAPHWIGGAGGAVLDLHLAADPADLAAGVMAGVASRIGEIVDVMRRGRVGLRRIVAGGGLAARAGLLPLQAALLGRAIERSLISEGSCRGAALLSGHSCGDWHLPTDRKLEFPAVRIAPGIPAPVARRYARRFRRARAFVGALASGS